MRDIFSPDVDEKVNGDSGPAALDQAIQGLNTEAAHVHSARGTNPDPLRVRVTFGIRGGVTTLWALATVLTAGLLWAVLRHGSFENAAAVEKQIVAAVLIGPTIATGWAIRSDEGELMPNLLAGTRLLLLSTAVFSVATAMSLGGMHPFGMSETTATHAFALAALLSAYPVAAAWLMARRATWAVLRRVLFTTARNLGIASATLLLSIAVVLHQGLPTVATGLLLIGASLVLAVLAANRTSRRINPKRDLVQLLANGGAAVTALFGAAAFLGYFHAGAAPAGSELNEVRRAFIGVAGLFALLMALAAYRRIGK